MSKEVTNKVNPGRVEYFTKWVNAYQERLGLINYDITVIGEYMDERGAIDVDEYGRLATISYSIDWLSASSTTESEINRTAFHEVVELCLNKIRIMLERYYSFEAVKTMIHDIIVRLENTLWKEWTKNYIECPSDLPYISSQTIPVEEIDPDQDVG